MRCSNCGSENPSDRKYCGECGAQFLLRCPTCGKKNVPPFRFCGECGASLADPVVARAEETKRITATAGERRHLTVLFCDLVGSTELAVRLDPEEWQETLATYHRSAASAIGRFGGHVANYLGDGVVAYFGFPEAHENDAERAARAGLAIIEAVSSLNPHRGPKLSARVGIDSGAVVVGAGAGAQTDVFGETPNIAARLQAAAAPDTVIVSAATHRLIAGHFVIEDSGRRPLKGIEQPVQLYRVVQPAAVRGRLGAAAVSHGLTPFVGREDELYLLTNRWQRALDGEGQVILIIGEAGIGKSRLV
jgi:class 3 adenylate cyclase